MKEFKCYLNLTQNSIFVNVRWFLFLSPPNLTAQPIRQGFINLRLPSIYYVAEDDFWASRHYLKTGITSVYSYALLAMLSLKLCA